MQNQDFGNHSATSARDAKTGGLAGAAGDALSKTKELTGQATEAARQAAADTASNVTSQVKDLLDRQVEAGASMIGHVADSAKRVADDLDRDAPQLAGLVRGLADRVAHYADDLRDQTVDELVRSASDFTRRQPALVFGLAALAGFFAFRTLKYTSSSSMISSPSLQPSQDGFSQPSQHGLGSSHGGVSSSSPGRGTSPQSGFGNTMSNHNGL